MRLRARGMRAPTNLIIDGVNFNSIFLACFSYLIKIRNGNKNSVIGLKITLSPRIKLAINCHLIPSYLRNRYNERSMQTVTYKFTYPKIKLNN